MRARDKLNLFVVSGCLLAALAVGSLAGSAAWFWAALALAVAACLAGGGIRPAPTRGRRR